MKKHLLDNSDIIPCQSRNLPPDTYQIVFNLLDKQISTDSLPTSTIQNQSSVPIIPQKIWMPILLSLPIIIGLTWYSKKKKTSIDHTPNATIKDHIRLDLIHSILYIDNTEIELSGKESHLMQILLDHPNQTVEKQKLLNEVWGDNGEYIGRTLDVFISKLRRKLEVTPHVKITNMRGVGYKLIIN